MILTGTITALALFALLFLRSRAPRGWLRTAGMVALSLAALGAGCHTSVRAYANLVPPPVPAPRREIAPGITYERRVEASVPRVEHWARVRAKCEEKFGGSAKVDELFPNEAYQLTHNALFPHDCFHVENLGGQISDPALHNKRITLGAFPWLFRGGEAAFCRAVAWTD